MNIRDRFLANASRGVIGALFAAIMPSVPLAMRWTGPRSRPNTAAHLHPTKGWRGDGTRPAGTNRRRRRAA